MSAAAGSSPDQGEVLFYTRPGCPVSALLRCRLRSQRIAVREIDIWADRQAAEVVRAASGGHETVPTIAVGRRTMVSPPSARFAPRSPPTPPDPWWPWWCWRCGWVWHSALRPRPTTSPQRCSPLPGPSAPGG
ncbi:MAG: hypothetical protein LC749_11225 [Actinobacteria bacterium]|nr:hypothetical protein [Actinomycetota bacterium]